MVRLTVSLTPTPGRSGQDLLDAFRFIVLGARLEEGCLNCTAWMDPDSTINYIEDWETETDMRRRVRSARFTSLLSVVESATRPRVQFDFIDATRGIDYVAEVRNDGT